MVAACGGEDAVAPTVPPPAGVPASECSPGDRKLDGGCIPAGVPPGACGEGFDSDGDGGCRALQPAETCGPGLFAIPGETQCRPVGACGEGEYPDLQGATSVQHVRAAYLGSNS